MYYYTFGNRSDYRNIFASLLNILRGIFFNISALTPYPPLDPSGLTPFTRNPSNSWNSFLPGATLPHVIPHPSMSGTHSSEQLYTSSLKRKCPDPSLVPRFLTVRKGRQNVLKETKEKSVKSIFGIFHITLDGVFGFGFRLRFGT